MSDKSSSEPPQYLLAGVVGPARGLKGEVFVKPRTDRVESVFAPGAIVLIDPAKPGENEENGGIELEVSRSRTHNGRFIVSFEEVTTRDQSEALRGAHLLTEPELEEDAWYPHEVEGLPVVDEEGLELGHVSGLASGAAHDMLLVRYQGQEVMVPLVKEIVLKVSPEENLVVLDPPLGLFPRAVQGDEQTE